MRTLRLVEIAEFLGVSKQCAHQIADEEGFPAPVGRDGRGRLWDRRKVERWASAGARRRLGAELLSAVQHRPSRAQGRGFAAGSPVARLAPGDVHHPPDRKSRERPTVVEGARTQGAEDEPKEVRIDNPSGMRRRSGWTWKVWVGIVVGLAVVAGLVVLIANAGGGSGGIY